MPGARSTAAARSPRSPGRLPGSILARGDQDRPADPRQPRDLDLALEHGHPMAQDQDFRVLGAAGPGEQSEPAERTEHHHQTNRIDMSTDSARL